MPALESIGVLTQVFPMMILFIVLLVLLVKLFLPVVGQVIVVRKHLSSVVRDSANKDGSVSSNKLKTGIFAYPGSFEGKVIAGSSLYSAVQNRFQDTVLSSVNSSELSSDTQILQKLASYKVK